jgi:hypothetical protein
MSDMATDLRAAVRYPPGQQDKLDDPYKTLKGHWATVGTPDTLYYTNEGVQTGGISPGGPPADAIFRAVLTYYAPPMPEYTTSLASITVSWPAQVDPADPATGTLAGSVSTFIATNR